jgi:hypothetical protein
MPEDAGHHSAVMERLPVAGTPPDQTTEILADMLREILESRHVTTDCGYERASAKAALKIVHETALRM